MITNNLINYNLKYKTSPAFTSNPDRAVSSYTSNTTELPQKKSSSSSERIFLAGISSIFNWGKSKITEQKLNAIDSKYDKLIENVSFMQFLFKETFMRDDITEEETVNTINRYREIEKLGITGTKEEYAIALFNEAKTNFGFENSNIKLNLYNNPNSKVAGKSHIGTNMIDINLAANKSAFLGNIHHEFRHAKQQYFAINANTAEYLNAIAQRDYNSTINYNGTNEFRLLTKKYALEHGNFESYFESNKCIFGEEGTLKNDLLKKYNLESFSPDNVPEKYKEFANKCIEACRNYINAEDNESKYRNNFLEKDAYTTGDTLANILKVY